MCGHGSSFFNEWADMVTPLPEHHSFREARQGSTDSFTSNNGKVIKEIAVRGGPFEQQCQPNSSTPWEAATGGQACTTSGCTASSGVSLPAGPCCSTDSLQQQLLCCRGPAAEQHASKQLLLGTSAGVYALDLASQQFQLLGLQSLEVASLNYSSRELLLAACPAPEESLHDISQPAVQVAKEAAGLYCLNLTRRRSSSIDSCTSSSSDSSVQTLRLWSGDASACTFAPEQQPTSEVVPQPVPRIYVGTQPAGLLCSDDFGTSWACCSLHEAPHADTWFRRLPPYEPCVRSITFAAGTSSSSSSSAGCSAGVNGQQQQPAQELVVAVEVGGALASSAPDQSVNWADISTGLCKDVHALQADPFNARRMYAVCGSGHLPGGIYRCKGKKWKRLYGYRYSVGMALSAFQKGRMLLVSADRAPAVGCCLFESVDAGRTWLNITDDVADAAAALTEHEPGLFEQTPLALYVPGGMVVACATGHVFLGITKPLGGFSNWQLVAKLPHTINCMCSCDPAVAPVSIRRS